MAPLDNPLKRLLTVRSKDHTLTLDPQELTEKGHRRGVELAWKDLLSGDAGLAAALHASVGKI